MINKKPNIVLIGEAGIDQWVRGSVRLSTESPTCIFNSDTIKKNPGMASNVAENLKSLCPDVLLTFLHQENIITKTRYIDNQFDYQLFRVDENDVAFEPNFFVNTIEDIIVAGSCQSFVFSDYGKGLMSEKFLEALSEIASIMNIPTWLDTRKILGDWSKNITYVKINQKEFDNQIKAGVKEPWKYCKNLIVTRGKHGADLYDSNGRVVYHVNALPIKIFSVAGAGDTFLAALVIKYLQKNDIIGAIDFANWASAAAVSKPGVVAITLKDMEDIAREN